MNTYAITSVKAEDFLTGWISSEGIFYPCDFESHYYLAQDLIKEVLETSYQGMPDDYLLKKGWIHVSTMSSFDITPSVYTEPGFRPTKKALDAFYLLAVESYKRGETQRFEELNHIWKSLSEKCNGD